MPKSILEEKVYYRLDGKIPETLYATYKGKTVSVMLYNIPTLDSRTTLLYEEIICKAQDYLLSLLLPKEKSILEKLEECLPKEYKVYKKGEFLEHRNEVNIIANEMRQACIDSLPEMLRVIRDSIRGELYFLDKEYHTNCPKMWIEPIEDMGNPCDMIPEDVIHQRHIGAVTGISRVKDKLLSLLRINDYDY